MCLIFAMFDYVYMVNCCFLEKNGGHLYELPMLMSSRPTTWMLPLSQC